MYVLFWGVSPKDSNSARLPGSVIDQQSVSGSGEGYTKDFGLTNKSFPPLQNPPTKHTLRESKYKRNCL